MRADRARAVTVGETMALVHSLEPGRLDLVPRVGLSIGGAESNTAIGLRRLGVPTTWIGRVGDDSLGERVVRTLRAENVEVVAPVDPSAPTGLMVKERRTSSRTSILYYRRDSAGSRLTPADLPSGVIERADVLHVTGITPALSSSAADAVHEAVDRARSAETLVAFDVNHRSRLWNADSARRAYLQIIARSDIVFAGVDEAALVLDAAETDSATLATGLAALGPSEVIIKRGADGAFARTPSETLVTSAIPVAVIDTVGAGDAFVAGYLAERIDGRSLKICLETATAAGASACTAPGDWESLPTRSDLAVMRRADPVTR